MLGCYIELLSKRKEHQNPDHTTPYRISDVMLPVDHRSDGRPGGSVKQLVTDLVHNSCCPVASCATFSGLRMQRQAVADWLAAEFGGHLAHPRLANAAGLNRWNTILVGKVRLLECRFGALFSWLGCSPDKTVEAGRHGFHPATLVGYYTDLAAFHSRRVGCAACRSTRPLRCLDGVDRCLAQWFPLLEAGPRVHPNPDDMSRSQMGAWSFLVSLATVAVVAHHVDSPGTVSWTLSFFHLARPLVEEALRSEGDDPTRSPPPSAPQR